jgi:hypothetical protein
MTAPYHQVYADGGPNVTGDGLNTFAQICQNVADARGFIGTQGMAMLLLGFVTPDDGGDGTFAWSPTGTAPDDGGITTIIPTGSVAGSGEWIRATPPPTAFNAIGGAQALAGLTQVLLPTINFNEGGYYNPSTSTYTPSVAGKYQFNFAVSFNGTTGTTNSINATLQKNGLSAVSITVPTIGSVTAAGIGTVVGAAFIAMNGAGDSITLVAQAFATTPSIGGSFLNGLRLCP